jgi:hypothetical protein
MPLTVQLPPWGQVHQMTEQDYEQWVETQRTRVERYLSAEGIYAPAVGPWPAFDLAPNFAIWAVESKLVPGKIGWWAFSGDCPTDYVSEDGGCHPRHALELLLKQWRKYVLQMKAGKQPEGASFGRGADLEELAQLLERRVLILTESLSDDSQWETA